MVYDVSSCVLQHPPVFCQMQGRRICWITHVLNSVMSLGLVSRFSATISRCPWKQKETVSVAQIKAAKRKAQCRKGRQNAKGKIWIPSLYRYCVGRQWTRTPLAFNGNQSYKYWRKRDWWWWYPFDYENFSQQSRDGLGNFIKVEKVGKELYLLSKFEVLREPCVIFGFRTDGIAHYWNI